MEPEPNSRALALAMYLLGLINGSGTYRKIAPFAERVAPELKLEIMSHVVDIFQAQLPYPIRNEMPQSIQQLSADITSVKRGKVRFMDNAHVRVLGLSLYYLGYMKSGHKYLSVSDFVEMAAPDIQVEVMECVANLLHRQIAYYAEPDPNNPAADPRDDLLAQLVADIAKFTR